MFIPYKNRKTNLSGGPEADLERQLINEYLRSRGYLRTDLKNLSIEERKVLMREACTYAAIRLANIEAKSLFRSKIRLP